ncbi:hypothetical protein [Salinicoccus albus]|uniref:hypothetical protein n=1 Tax=Salinicoccus albus TaxID=418756 RepID=UPI00037048C0|nr:hypothetical protein [Salinicoccus albus]
MLRKLQRRHIFRDLKRSEQIEQLESEKRDLTAALNRASRANNFRSDQNWDSRPRTENAEGIHGIDRENPERQVKFIHENGERIIISTDDDWESSKILYRE